MFLCLSCTLVSKQNGASESDTKTRVCFLSEYSVVLYSCSLSALIPIIGNTRDQWCNKTNQYVTRSEVGDVSNSAMSSFSIPNREQTDWAKLVFYFCLEKVRVKNEAMRVMPNSRSTATNGQWKQEHRKSIC